MTEAKKAQKEWAWDFWAFRTLQGNQPIQEWWDSLADDARDELLDTLRFLRVSPNNLWRRPKFAPVEDEIFEIRGHTASEELRIYGYFPGAAQTFTFLNGTDKKVRNDRQGKRLAKQRLKLLRSKQATTHKFEFDRNASGASKQESSD